MFILDPTLETDVKFVNMSPRLKSIDNKTVGLLSNGKAAVAPLFDNLELMIQRKWNVKTVVRRTKLNYSVPADPDLIQELSKCHFIVTGVGD